MSMFDGILGQVGSNFDIANLAAKVGIDPALAEKAVAALGVAHPQPGDTVTTAAASTGIDSGTLTQIVGHLGGEGSLGQFAQLMQDHPEASGFLSKLDQDGDGNPLNDVMGMAKNLFSKT
ncbi:hypothetical protein OLX02_03975 [Novosphingobium sp. KCTC 2891]|uniref:hypothetical protein n=1 Tax=Novosphingobium sp. KCTC 2891 TaxID=2989730 RepID=UPI0022221CBE|nr:hypothetical protein [Novosphingobium sp. KCTC 2891]MCW1381972.1 hypothetical protein [Novosphingobium sp. KCTC 2891]